jgi:anti-anti-sigma regulatory factor
MSIRITEIGRHEASDLTCGEPEQQHHSADTVAGSAAKTTIFKVEGSLHLKDAELLERICREVSEQTAQLVIIEVSDLCFLDSASAAVLCRMKREQGVIFEGMNLFMKKVIELTDESAKVCAKSSLTNPSSPCSES